VAPLGLKSQSAGSVRSSFTGEEATCGTSFDESLKPPEAAAAAAAALRADMSSRSRAPGTLGPDAETGDVVAIGADLPGVIDSVAGLRWSIWPQCGAFP
jgi:hypothetical protein